MTSVGRTIETLEDALAVSLSYNKTFTPDRENYLCLFNSERYVNRGTRVGVLDRVIHQLSYRRQDQLMVGQHRGLAVRIAYSNAARGRLPIRVSQWCRVPVSTGRAPAAAA